MKCKLLIFSLLFLIFAACQTEIEVDLPDYEPKLIVEGYIENGQRAYVMLTRSIPYFQGIDLEYIINNVLVLDADVTITSSDGETEKLSLMPYGESPFYFAYVSNMVGKENTTYDLEIKWAGKTYTSRTSILHTFELDSIGLDHSLETLADTSYTVRVLMTDDASEMNYYQFFIKIHGRKLHDNIWVTALPVSFDDATFNGQQFTYEVLRSNPSTFFMPKMDEEAQREYFRMTCRPGDTVYVKHCQMDYDSYQFWNTGGNEAAMGQNPFMNPAPIISNIHGDNVSGLWCGYAAKTDVLIYDEIVKPKR